MTDQESAIRSLISRSAFYGDTAAPESYAEIYTADAVWEMGAVQQEGIDAIIEATHRRRTDGISGPGTASRHVVVPMRVEVDGERGHAWSYLLFYRSTDSTPTVELFAVYEDTVRLENDRWQIERRTVLVDRAAGS
ncbi:nuclear transport factor 2 family protein [Microbacterium sp. A588]